MSFNTGLSGVQAAQADLGVTSNNIANVSTVGFKESRAEFGDIYATSALGASSNTIGSGVLLTQVAQQFTQGNLEFTNNTLDFAVSGEGFFVLAPNLLSNEFVYTRAGAFGVDSNGFVVNAQGQSLRVFPVNPDGTVTSTSLSSTIPLQLPQTAGNPTATTEIDLGMNLEANATVLDPNNFDPTISTSYTASTSITIYDSLGESHIATYYFVKDAANSWANFLYVDGQAVDIVGGTATTNPATPDYATLAFDSGGAYDPAAQVPLDPITTAPLGAGIIDNGADSTQTIVLDYSSNSPTQFASPFTVNSLSQNGFSIGRLTGIDISDDGVIRANFSNGQSEAVGKVALVRFANNQGLSQLGNATWAESINSGEPLAGEANTSTFGLIRSGALEQANLDLTSELVDLITAQRNFQANARSIETSNTVTQTIINIR
ncbi:MAG: flagellar hook protein FlgE [Pseudomonadota bacterium]